MDLDQEPLRRLEYRSPDLNPRAISGWQVVGGLIMAPVTLIVATLLGAFLASVLGGRNGEAIAAGMLLGALAGAGLILWWAAWADRNGGWRGFALGLWIGGGLVVLLSGACFMAAWR